MHPAAPKKVQIMSTFFDRFDYYKALINAKIKRFLRITRFWGMFCPGRAIGYRQRQNKNVVYLYLFFNPWITCHSLFCIGFCKKYKALYFIGKKKPFKVLALKGYHFYSLKNCVK